MPSHSRFFLRQIDYPLRGLSAQLHVEFAAKSSGLNSDPPPRSSFLRRSPPHALALHLISRSVTDASPWLGRKLNRQGLNQVIVLKPVWIFYAQTTHQVGDVMEEVLITVGSFPVVGDEPDEQVDSIFRAPKKANERILSHTNPIPYCI